jgi:hypothetical protein
MSESERVFPNAGVDLSDSRFTTGDLTWAEDFLVGNIKINDPAWLQRPRGPLGARWARSSTYNAEYLIHVALTVEKLILGVNPDSLLILQSKFRSLLRPGSEKQFEELLTELEAGAVVLESVSPLTLEPLAGAGQEEHSRLPSPDYSIELPSGAVFIEVTQASFGFMDNWSAAAKIAADRMRARIGRRGLNRDVKIAAPILATAEQMGRLSETDVLDVITDRPTGELSIRLTSGIARLCWQSVPTESELKQGAGEMGTARNEIRFSISDDEAVSYRFVFGVSFTALIDDDLEEKILRSLRNTLDDKRKQMTMDAPYVLFLRVDQVDPAAVADLILRRITPNPDYGKFTAIAIFQPARSWGRGEDYGEDIQIVFNGNARHLASQSLRDALLNRAEFHAEVPER